MPPPPPPPPARPVEVAPGSYFWQVMAVGQSAAKTLAQMLEDKGFPVLLTPGNNGMTRVLVGPYLDSDRFARVRIDLEAAGMHPVVFRK